MADDAERLLSGDAWHDFCDRRRAVGDTLLGNAFPDAPRDRAEGSRAITPHTIDPTQRELEAAHTLFY